MTKASKRKWQFTSRSLFGSRAPNKRCNVDGQIDEVTTQVTTQSLCNGPSELANVHDATQGADYESCSDLSFAPHGLATPSELQGALIRRRSHVGFAHQLSEKICSTFGYPTIVHRPKQHTRPSMLAVDFLSTQSITAQDEGPDQSYINRLLPDATFATEASVNDHSKGITLLRADVDTLQPSEFTVPCTAAPRDPVLATHRSIHTANPTILTVETTANAKIFFETYYDPLLASSTTPRSLRRQALETRLSLAPFSEEKRHSERIHWARGESAHLRQIRLQKSKIRNGRNSSLATAGFETVRILGKGSFGVVRLVRERAEPKLLTLPGEDPLVDNCISPNNTNYYSSESQSARSNPGFFAQHSYRQIPDGDVYAIKVIRKSDMLRNCQEGHLRAERDFLVASERSRWVVPLVASFQDDTNLYLVMEYMVGGDFLGLLFRKNILKERHARWYIAEMLLCVEETHRCGWIHRDIKPDNFLISSSGHLKISDFGLAFDGHWSHDQRFFKNHRKILLEKLGIEVQGDFEDQQEDAKKALSSHLVGLPVVKAHIPQGQGQRPDGPCDDEPILHWRNREGKRRMAGSVVGTSQYMAPEVIQGDPYDGRCDWWSIGIILYECLYGFTPFVCENRDETKRRIVNHHSCLAFPRDRDYKVSFEAVELISELLRDKEYRLCSKRYRLNDYQRSKHESNKFVNRFTDSRSSDGNGRFVYPDDAVDVKCHRFFDRIAWDRHHLTRPPFVPDVSGKDDTKYFDEEEPVSDFQGSTSPLESQNGFLEPRCMAKACSRPVTQVRGIDGQVDTLDQKAVASVKEYKVQGKRQKRPRDKVLRDQNLSKQALEIRKKGVFIGYTYRRPRGMVGSETMTQRGNES